MARAFGKTDPLLLAGGRKEERKQYPRAEPFGSHQRKKKPNAFDLDGIWCPSSPPSFCFFTSLRPSLLPSFLPLPFRPFRNRKTHCTCQFQCLSGQAWRSPATGPHLAVRLPSTPLQCRACCTAASQQNDMQATKSTEA